MTEIMCHLFDLLFSDLMQKEDWKSLGFHEEDKDNVKNAT